MSNELEKFTKHFDSEMEKFIEWHLKEVSYKTAAYAQKIVNLYRFPENKVPSEIHHEIECFLDYLEKILMDCKPSLKELRTIKKKSITAEI